MEGERKKPYRAYLLRCWYEGETVEDQAFNWRFSLEEVLDDRRRLGFSHLEEVMAFLQAELAAHSQIDELPGFSQKGGEMAD